MAPTTVDATRNELFAVVLALGNITDELNIVKTSPNSELLSCWNKEGGRDIDTAIFSETLVELSFVILENKVPVRKVEGYNIQSYNKPTLTTIR